MSAICRSWCRSLVLVFVMGGTTTCLRAEDDVSPVTLVGESAALCLEIPHFEETWSKFHRSQMASRLKSFPLVERLLSGPGFMKWMGIEQHSRRVTRKTVSDHLIGAFSDSIVVAIYLRDGQKPQGILIGQARTEFALKQAVQAWLTLDPHHVSQVREHHGQTYIHRVKSGNSSEIGFHASFGRIFVMSEDESLIQEIIDRRAELLQKSDDRNKIPSVGNLIQLESYRQSRGRLSKNAAAYLFLNVRAWDRVLEDGIQKSPDREIVGNVIQSIASLGLSLSVDDEAIVEIIAEIGNDARSPAWRKFVESTNRVADWTKRIPADAILAVSGRMEVRPLLHAWLEYIPQSKSPEFIRGRSMLNSIMMGRDVFEDIVPGLLREWTISLNSLDGLAIGPPVGLKGQFSFNDDASKDPPLGQCVDNALHFGINLAAGLLSFQSGDSAKSIVAKSESTKVGTVRSLTGLTTWSPCYIVAPQELNVSSNRETLLSATTVEHSRSVRLAALQSRHFADTTQLIWLDAVRLRELLNSHGAWISEQIAPGSANDRQRIQVHFAGIREMLKPIDAAFISARFSDDHVRIVFGVAMDRVN